MFGLLICNIIVTSILAYYVYRLSCDLYSLRIEIFQNKKVK